MGRKARAFGCAQDRLWISQDHAGKLMALRLLLLEQAIVQYESQARPRFAHYVSQCSLVLVALSISIVPFSYSELIEFR